MLIQSPMNYTGGKFKLLSQILPLFPENISTFVDLFCGGCNVGINVNANNIIFNDSNTYLFALYRVFQEEELNNILKTIFEIIKNYNLSLVSEKGYDYYGCNSSDGLGNYNRENFLKLRSDFNKITIKDNKYYLTLFVLIVYAFNNQIRFNSKNEFNLPIGKRDFNEKMQKKLVDFLTRIKTKKISFQCYDFREFDVSNLSEKDFVYMDPPYLITCATYNENGGWSEQDEKDLLKFIDKLNEKKIRFALSNVLRSKGKENNLLINWLKDRNYKLIPLNYSYSNSNYQTKEKKSISEESLIINY